MENLATDSHLSLAWGLFPEVLTPRHFQSAWHPACSCGQRKLLGEGRQVCATESSQCVQECWVPRRYEWCQKYLLQRHSWLYKHYWSFLLMRGNQKISNQGWQDVESINCNHCGSSPILFPDGSLYSSPQPPSCHWRSGYGRLEKISAYLLRRPWKQFRGRVLQSTASKRIQCLSHQWELHAYIPRK